LNGHCTGGKPLSFAARPWCDVPDAAFQNEPDIAWHARARQCAHYLSEGSAAYEIAAARATCCVGRSSAHVRRTATAPAGSLSLSARGRGATCQMRPSKMSRLSCGMRERVNALTITQGEAQHASLLLSAPCCVGCCQSMPEATFFRRAAVVRLASCGLKELAGVHVACASAPLRSLYLGRMRSARACCERAPCRAGCGRPMPYERPLHRRKATLFRRAAEMRRARCGLPK